METVGQAMEAGSQQDVQNIATDQQYSASQNMVTQSSTPQAEIDQRGGYETQDCCADTCYCIGFIFTLGLISLCCQPDDMY